MNLCVSKPPDLQYKEAYGPETALGCIQCSGKGALLVKLDDNTVILNAHMQADTLVSTGSQSGGLSPPPPRELAN